MKVKLIVGMLLFFISISKLTHAQYVNFGIDKAQFKRFEDAITLYVVLTGDKTFDEALQDAVHNYWKIKPFAFIDTVTARTKLVDPDFCFLKIVSSAVTVVYTSNNSSSSTDYYGTEMGIYMGGPKSIERSSGGAEFGSEVQVADAPFDSHGSDLNIKDAIYKLPMMIKGLNDGLAFVQTNKLKGYGGMFRVKYCREMSANASIIKNKTLLILDVLDKDVTQKRASIETTALTKELMKGYPFKYKYATAEELKDLIDHNSKDYCFLDPCLCLSRNIIVYDLETLSPVYIRLSSYYVRKGLTTLEPFADENEIAELVSGINGKYKTASK